MKKRLAALAAAAFAAFGSNPAMASSTASATLSGFTFTLVDLDTSDGILPSIAFLSDHGVSQAYTYVTNGGGGYGAFTGYGSGPWAPAASSSSVYGTSASATVSVPGAPATLSLGASGTTSGTTGTFSSFFMAYAMAPDPSYLSFSLGANTSVTISATYSLSTVVTSGPAQEYGYAKTYLAVTGSGPYGIASQSDFVNQSINVYSYWNGALYAGDSASAAGIMSVNFVNHTSGSLDGILHAESYVYGESAVPVPEPGSWAMLLAGIGMLGFMTRRRLRR